MEEGRGNRGCAPPLPVRVNIALSRPPSAGPADWGASSKVTDCCQRPPSAWTWTPDLQVAIPSRRPAVGNRRVINGVGTRVSGSEGPGRRMGRSVPGSPAAATSPGVTAAKMAHDASRGLPSHREAIVGVRNSAIGREGALLPPPSTSNPRAPTYHTAGSSVNHHIICRNMGGRQKERSQYAHASVILITFPGGYSYCAHRTCRRRASLTSRSMTDAPLSPYFSSTTPATWIDELHS